VPEKQKIKAVIINGKEIDFIQIDNTIILTVTFAGKYFSHMQQIGSYDPDFSGGDIVENIVIPERIFRQLGNRKKEWPINWTNSDLKTTWLAPERLLLFVQIAEPGEVMDIELKIDGKTVTLKKAYTSIRRHPRCFVGWYADISNLKADINHNFILSLPELKPGQFQGIFLENIETEYTDVLTN
jgi:hypothetical protein